jgi:hypothetical protein
MQTSVRYGAIAAIIPAWLLSVAVLISAVHFNVAQAQDKPKTDRVALATACGKQLKDQCSGVPVHGNNLLACLQASENKLSAGCAALANNVVRTCERDAMRRCQGVVAGNSNILSCLTTARHSVSSRCNAALDAAFLR